MATAAEPQPASLPITGGRDQATVRLYPLVVGQAMGAAGVVPPRARRPPRLARAFGIGVPKDQWVKAPVQCFLVEHPSAGTILIDTGFHASVAVDPQLEPRPLFASTLTATSTWARAGAAAQLRERGIEPSTVEHVIMTHLHPDHASAIVDYPEATFLVSSAEWEAASERRAARRLRQAPVRPRLRLPPDRLRLERPDSFSGFARSFDVFGDGSVRVVFTPGHTLGHMSVVLRTAKGEVLVAGDAIFMRRTLDDDHLPHLVADEHLFRRSLREIQQYRRRRRTR